MDAGTRRNGWLTLKLPFYCIGRQCKNLAGITSQDQTCQQKKVLLCGCPDGTGCRDYAWNVNSHRLKHPRLTWSSARPPPVPAWRHKPRLVSWLVIGSVSRPVTTLYHCYCSVNCSSSSSVQSYYPPTSFGISTDQFLFDFSYDL